MKKLAVGIVLIGLSGCAVATTENYEAILQSWIGQPVESLIASWGPPQSSATLNNGVRILEYWYVYNRHVPGYTYMAPQTTYHQGAVGGTTYSGTSTRYIAQRVSGYDVNLMCKTRITINPQGLVSNWTYQGNNCKASR